VVRCRVPFPFLPFFSMWPTRDERPPVFLLSLVRSKRLSPDGRRAGALCLVIPVSSRSFVRTQRPPRSSLETDTITRQETSFLSSFANPPSCIPSPRTSRAPQPRSTMNYGPSSPPCLIASRPPARNFFLAAHPSRTVRFVFWNFDLAVEVKSLFRSRDSF